MEDNIFRFLIRFVTAEFFALLGFLFGAWDGLMKALVAFVIIDYITGLIAATKRRKLNSNVGFKGIAKKAMIFTIVAVCHRHAGCRRRQSAAAVNDNRILYCERGLVDT